MFGIAHQPSGVWSNKWVPIREELVDAHDVLGLPNGYLQLPNIDLGLSNKNYGLP